MTKNNRFDFDNIKSTYERNREWADKFIPLTIKILKKELGYKYIEESPITFDMYCSFDLIMGNQGEHKLKTCGVRTRKFKYYKDFNNEVTFRTTELKKFKNRNYPHFYFYGFMNKNETNYIQYKIFEMKNIIKNIFKITKKYNLITNTDQCTSFKAIKDEDIRKHTNIIYKQTF